MPESYYAILGVSQNATRKQIRDRFLALARDRHPDRFKGEEKTRAEKEFQAITEAFNVLSNPERRRRHDNELARPETQTVDPGQVAKVYLQRGVKAYREKNYLEAAENFDRATREQPANARAWHHLARACSHQRRWLSRAVKAIEKACELDPMNPDYHKVAGKIFEQAGMNTRAAQAYRTALRWGEDDPALAQKADALEGKKKSGFFGRGGG